MSLLEAERLAAFRGDHLVLQEVSFTLRPGEALLLHGPNGAGKTTLLRLLAGFLRPAAGRLLWDGGNVLDDLPLHGLRIGWLGYQDGIKPGLTVAENLAPWQRAAHASGAGLGQGQRMAALAAMGMDAFADLPSRMLSAGQRRRLAICRLILAEAPLWLLDEPTVALDSKAIGQLGALLAAHRTAGGMVIAATHVDLPLPQAARLDLV
ncbi:heme ABC exporter ATP-binding protein CcmA [Acidisoma sp. C75]